ncbi:helix-turn-helix transcriptional regulator [Lentzea cavernae]|uniref:Helix-turn-helix transcriptional regulator n=1 Tax=Lentzea cavernae TaxID=2020703 RepID=A0ABQ3MT21_9PSEU|nr:response regulator transcription factor [Lentzea cavernae]GHH56544.1 helix-turn-helix transcriptional regulator [Lentzea cavernae]
MEPVRVAVLAVDSIMEAGLTSFLRGREEVTVVDRAELSGRDVLVVQASHLTPRLIGQLRSAPVLEAAPKVLLADQFQETDVLTAVECRVASVLLRAHTTSDQLVDSVVAVTGGRAMLPAEMLGQLLDKVRWLQREVMEPRGLGAAGLTAREVDVLRLMAEGRDTAEIADELCYSVRTVKNVIYALTTRLNLRNRPHAVAYAMRAGVI